MMGKITVGFLPWWPANPYQVLLKQELNKLGMRVIGNPSLSLLRLLVGRDGLDVLHVHWPHGTYKTPLQFLHVLITLAAYRLLKNNVVWTVHELDAYESLHPRRDAWLRSVVMKLSCCLIVHGEHTRSVLIEQYGYRRPIHVARHSSYIGWYKDEVTREQARRKLDLPEDAQVFLYFGYIKPYKGVEDLIRAFGQLPDKNAVLYIVGKPLDDAIKHDVETLAATDSRIRTHLAYISDDEIQYFFRAANVVVFPFRQTQTSGSLMLALSYGCPVIVPAIATLPEYVGSDSGILFDPAKPGDLTRAILEATHAPLAQMAVNARLRAEASSWNEMAAVHDQVYQNAVGEA
ncbi:MAG: glycosyltransferase family 4 protein [Thiobacillus sp.]|nr:glycosyltransferase family 4 protein [Thiobacillus sp.]